MAVAASAPTLTANTSTGLEIDVSTSGIIIAIWGGKIKSRDLPKKGGFFVSKRSKAQKEADKRYEEKRAGQRTRNWAVIFYPEDLPEDWMEQVDGLLVKWIQSPLHDQDFNPDGEPKKAHYHTLFMFENVKMQDQVAEIFKGLFGESESGSIVGVAAPQRVTDRCGVVRYMAHLDNPSKAQYDPAEIIGHNGADPAEIMRYSATETREMIIAMEEYIEYHEITELCDFSAAIRYDKPEWHTILSTKMTVYFNAFIRSCRHKKREGKPLQQPKVDPTTGEVVGSGVGE